MKLALISLDQSWEDKLTNQERVRNALESVKDEKCDLVILPEMTLTGFSTNIKEIAENRAGSETISYFKSIAINYEIGLIFGAVFWRGDKAINNLVYIDSSGAVRAEYTKIHPFTYAKEDSYYEKGAEIISCMVSGFSMGFSICYDLRFPEIFSAMSRSCDVIVNIANWPARRISHWHALLKARAIENQVYMIGVNRIGSDGNGLEYVKSSQIVHPNGDVLTHEAAGKNLDIDIYKIDQQSLISLRGAFPVHSDRRPELYRQII